MTGVGDPAAVFGDSFTPPRMACAGEGGTPSTRNPTCRVAGIAAVALTRRRSGRSLMLVRRSAGGLEPPSMAYDRNGTKSSSIAMLYIETAISGLSLQCTPVRLCPSRDFAVARNVKFTTDQDARSL